MGVVHSSNQGMFYAPNIFDVKRVSSNFFESHEGKSISDSIGSIVKCVFIREMLKNEQGVSGVDDILSVITSETKPSTKKWIFSLVRNLVASRKKVRSPENIAKFLVLRGYTY